MTFFEADASGEILSLDLLLPLEKWGRIYFLAQPAVQGKAGHCPHFFSSLIPAAYEALMEQLDDLDLSRLVRERQDEPAERVTLDEL